MGKPLRLSIPNIYNSWEGVSYVNQRLLVLKKKYDLFTKILLVVVSVSDIIT